MSLPKTFTGGERLFAADLNSNFEDLDGRFATIDLEDLANVGGSPTGGQILAWNSSTSQWEPINMKTKKVAAFTASGTWTVPANVTYAIAHMLGGGGGAGSASAGNGGDSSVAFAGGTATAPGGNAYNQSISSVRQTSAGRANSGDGAFFAHSGGQSQRESYTSPSTSVNGARIVAADSVTPGASITVTVGAGGSAGTSGSAGGSGYVYIEYYE